MDRIATCSIIKGNGGVEAYKKFEDCEYALDADALAYIQQLEKSHEENCTNCAFARDAAWQCQVCRWCNDKALKIMWMQGPRKDV